jgi:hypothetical protein
MAKALWTDHAAEPAIGQPAVAPLHTNDLNPLSSVNMENRFRHAESGDFLLKYE